MVWVIFGLQEGGATVGGHSAASRVLVEKIFGQTSVFWLVRHEPMNVSQGIWRSKIYMAGGIALVCGFWVAHGGGKHHVLPLYLII